MGIAAVLAEPVAQPPHVADRIAGKAEGEEAGVEGAALGTQCLVGAAEQLRGPGQTVGAVAEDAS